MNVLPEDHYKAAALERCSQFCIEKAIEANERGLRTRIIDHFIDSKNWLVESARCQQELEELKAKKEEYDGAQIIYVRAKILGGRSNG